MGMLIKKPKYTPPPEIAESRIELAKREAITDAEEKKQLRSIAARRKATKGGSILMNEQNLDLLSKQEVPEISFRDPMKDERYR